MLRTTLLLLAILALTSADSSFSAYYGFSETLGKGEYIDSYEALDELIPAIMDSWFGRSERFAASRSAVKRQDLDDPWYHISCDVCHATLGSVKSLATSSLFDNVLDLIIIDVCGTQLNRTVCAGAIREMTPYVMNSFFNGVASADYICYELDMCSDPKFEKLHYQDYIDTVLATKPKELDSNDYLNKLYATVKEGDETIKILHLTDPHVDFNYTVGSNQNCNTPLCCRPENGPAPTPADAAGQWGSYQCDPPVWLAESAFRYIKKEVPDLAGIVWTGDNIQHNIWAQTTEESVWNTQQLTNLLQGHFEDIPAFPVLGNHEPIPVNVYDTEDKKNPLNMGIGAAWVDWLDDAALKQFQETGYYEMEMGILPNTRFIGVNSQACNNQNFEFFKLHADPGNQLEWLEQRFKAARVDGKGVWLASHITTGQGACFSEWGIRFRALTDAFQDVVRVHLAGHSHSEFFELMRDAAVQDKPIHAILGGGSITTYTNKNPNLQVLEVHKATGLVLNSMAYAINLPDANAAPDQDPNWALKFDYLSEYGLKDLSPASLDDLVNRMKDDEALALKYKANSRLAYEASNDSCDAGCRHGLWCKVRHSLNWSTADCNGSPHIDFKNDFEDAFLETTMAGWIQEKKSEEVK